MNSEKKISFGFNKLSKKPIVINKPQEKTVDYIVCLEEQSIKLKHEPKEIAKVPLVIPLKDNQKDLLDRVKDMKAEQINVLKAENEEVEETRPDSELTIDELATREVIRDAKMKLQQTDSKHHKTFVVPMKKEDELPLDGEKESTLTDYENVPVGDFGLAMLRGMGWKEGIGIGKNPSKAAVTQAPELRPKGLGLGANPASSDQQQPVCDKDGKVLILKRGSYAKVVAGSKKGTYCEVQGLDDEAGRVIVKTSLKDEILTLNEFMLVAITKEEYSKNSKVINSAKFEEYKEMEKVKIEADIKSEKNDGYLSNSEEKNNMGIRKESNREKNQDHKTQVKKERFYTSDEEYLNDSKRKDKLESKSKKYKDPSDSDSDDRRSRRIHKRKDKRRHRDKSRSPNRTKHKSGRKSSKIKHKYLSSSESEYERKKSKSRNRKSADSEDDRYKRKNKR